MQSFFLEVIFQAMGKFGQKSVAPPKICLFLHLWVCNSSRHQRFVREKFFKNDTSETISQKFHDL